MDTASESLAVHRHDKQRQAYESFIERCRKGRKSGERMRERGKERGTVTRST
ncbi:hypothetical protein AN958_00007 [Leucoagaricus sp. SymC.cos]|nr:hypothetical protein AN958_00007 [Leucoagaricus sp. SymC.cos]